MTVGDNGKDVMLIQEFMLSGESTLLQSNQWKKGILFSIVQSTIQFVANEGN